MPFRVILSVAINLMRVRAAVRTYTTLHRAIIAVNPRIAHHWMPALSLHANNTLGYGGAYSPAVLPHATAQPCGSSTPSPDPQATPDAGVSGYIQVPRRWRWRVAGRCVREASSAGARPGHPLSRRGRHGCQDQLPPVLCRRRAVVAGESAVTLVLIPRAWCTPTVDSARLTPRGMHSSCCGCPGTLGGRECGRESDTAGAVWRRCA